MDATQCVARTRQMILFHTWFSCSNIFCCHQWICNLLRNSSNFWKFILAILTPPLNFFFSKRMLSRSASKSDAVRSVLDSNSYVKWSFSWNKFYICELNTYSERNNSNFVQLQWNSKLAFGLPFNFGIRKWLHEICN